MPESSSQSNRTANTVLAAAILATAFLRILSFFLYPLPDKSEALYAEVAREMFASGNWITPQLGLSPFWAKPPLSTWLTALSFKLFGLSELAARIPSFLIIVLIAACIFAWGRRQRDATYGLAAAMVFSTCLLSFISAGAVMTDAALALGTFMAMVGFWLCMDPGSRYARFWGYILFAGLGLGLLAKGPVALVVSGLPVAAWLTVRGKWREALTRLPIVGGLLLTAAVALPWYLAAEARTPGFLRYFFIGENFERFLVPGWKGDLYGSAHRQPYGYIWVLGLLATLPWSAVLVTWGAARLARWRRFHLRAFDGWTSYLALWALMPMLFFSFARNLLWTYPLPALPAFAFLLAGVFYPEAKEGEAGPMRRWPGVVSLAPSLILLVSLMFWNLGVLHVHMSQRSLVEAFEALNEGRGGKLVYYRTRPWSAEFYSGGTVRQVDRPADMEPFFENSAQDYFAVETYLVHRIPEDERNRMEAMGEYDDYLLFRERGGEKRVVQAEAGGAAPLAASPPKAVPVPPSREVASSMAAKGG
ncbi:MAG: glycosyltransferase family 39 protein [Thermodesulfobacteriota bacterium]